MNKKFLAFLLISAMVLPLFTTVAYGEDYIKEIDAGFNSIQIHIGNNRISNHKEPFMYDDSLWVPLKDLAQGLNLKYKMNKGKKSIGLDSNGKLKIDGPNAKKIKSFQAGYEIEAKERIIRDLEGIYGSPKDKTPEMRNIKVIFGGWKLYLDGRRLDVDSLYYNDDLYVDILDIAPYLYITPSYKADKGILNIDANGVLARDSFYKNIDQLLSFREGRNYLLNIQMEQLEKRMALRESLRGLPYAKLKDIKDVEKYLNKHFDRIGSLEVDIHAHEALGKWIYLDISFPRSRAYRWYGLQRKEVEDWIWDMYTALLKLYDEDVLLYGAIRNPYYHRYSNSKYKNYTTFDTREKDLYFDFSRSQLKKDYKFNPIHLTDTLNTTLKKYNKVNFNYEISQSGDDIDLKAYPDSNWVKDWSLYTKMGYLKRLNWEIRRVYPDLAVNGILIFPKEDIEPIRFHFDNNRIRSQDMLRETEVHLNNLYGSFSYGRYSYGLDFNIYEKSVDDLSLIVEGDFSIQEDEWTNAGEGAVDRLNTRVQNAISTLMSLWDMNISTEVVDKNGITITELDIYQKNVGVVYANPSSGEIKEGTLVYLYTDTPGADIYYTLDGSTPTRQSYRYTEPIIVSRDLTINAFGYKEGMGAGPITTLEYTVVSDDS